MILTNVTIFSFMGKHDELNPPVSPHTNLDDDEIQIHPNTYTPSVGCHWMLLLMDPLPPSELRAYVFDAKTFVGILVELMPWGSGGSHGFRSIRMRPPRKLSVSAAQGPCPRQRSKSRTCARTAPPTHHARKRSEDEAKVGLVSTKPSNI